MSLSRNDDVPDGFLGRFCAKWRAMPAGRKLYILMMASLVALTTFVAAGSMWLACNGVRYVANVEDDALLYKVFAWIIVAMAAVFAGAMAVGYFVISGFVKRIEQDRLAKEQMSRAMYHGIATPIIDVRDQVEMFRLGYCGKDEMCDFVAKNCESLLRLVKTKSTLSRNRGMVSLSKPEKLDLSMEVRKATEAYLCAAQKRGIVLSLDGVPESLHALAHLERINTIVENLVGNAVKYTPKGGRVDVSLRVAKPGLARRLARRLTSRCKRTGVVLTVADTGIGISAHDQARMYDEFYRGEEAKKMEPGDGEGLALVHAIAVPFYGGDIKCKSKVGAGTEFTVTLPLPVL